MSQEEAAGRRHGGVPCNVPLLTFFLVSFLSVSTGIVCHSSGPQETGAGPSEQTEGAEGAVKGE